ncbi:MAG: AzlD domain-containing protein [Treponemataceae bacterium]|nr:AzlD domain-containing protein [Treponemataceae bacterium]
MNRAAVSILVIALVTALCRFLPFMIFRSDKKTPDFISYLGKALPFAIMGMLVVFCLKSVDFMGGGQGSVSAGEGVASFLNSHGLPEIISILVIGLVHFLKRNSILSILAGTVTYVLIVNLV